MSEKVVLAIHGSHDASFTLLDKTGRLRVIEVERIVKKRYAAFSEEHTNRSFGITDEDRQHVIAYINSWIDDEKLITHVIFSHLTTKDILMLSEDLKTLKDGTVYCNFGSHHLNSCLWITLSIRS